MSGFRLDLASKFDTLGRAGAAARQDKDATPSEEGLAENPPPEDDDEDAPAAA
jgi:hypothetical protein